MLKEFKKGFTLAEVLIVIGIIGVVAALTLPNLNHATGDKETVTKVKKIYSALTEALDRAQVIYGPFDTWFVDLYDQYGVVAESNNILASERFAKRITEFMKVSKDCGLDAGCYPTEIKGFDGDDNGVFKGFYNYVLKDGTALSFNARAARVFIDVNGINKGQNRTGYDVFNFLISDNELCACEIPILTGECTNTPDYYVHWIIENGNLDYLKTDEDGKCPDGQPLNWETKISCN